MSIRIAAAGLTLALIACGDADAPTNVEVPGPSAVQDQLESLPEGQRNGVFIRAIRDAGEECQEVENSTRTGEHQGFPVWSAECDDGGSYSIIVQNGGNAAVLDNSEARLGGDGNRQRPVD